MQIATLLGVYCALRLLNVDGYVASRHLPEVKVLYHDPVYLLGHEPEANLVSFTAYAKLCQEAGASLQHVTVQECDIPISFDAVKVNNKIYLASRSK